MKHEDEIFEPVDIMQFNDLADCVEYYTDVLSSIKESFEIGIFTKKEFKDKKKNIMKQFNASLKLINKKDDHYRTKEEKNLKPKKDKKTLEKIYCKPKTEAITPSKEQYQIEDSKEKRINNEG